VSGTAGVVARSHKQVPRVLETHGRTMAPTVHWPLHTPRTMSFCYSCC